MRATTARVFFQFSLFSLAGVLVAVTAAGARADQRRDWMVAAQPGGTYLNLDVVFPGVQAQVEHRKPIYGMANELSLKANALAAVPFYESQADVDLRLLVLSLGASVGFRDNYQAMTFRAGEPIDRMHRRNRQMSGRYDDVFNGFGEGRATLALPFNEHSLFLSVNALRFEGGPDRVFDWRMGVVRDDGMYFRSTSTLFLKHRTLGAAGPMLEVLNFDDAGVNHTQVNYGFTLVTRPGFRRDNDIFFLAVLFNFDYSGKGDSTADVYGSHLFYGPFTFQLAYRSVFELVGPSKPGDEIDEE